LNLFYIFAVAVTADVAGVVAAVVDVVAIVDAAVLEVVLAEEKIGFWSLWLSVLSSSFIFLSPIKNCPES
jgi:hypothetical protein